MLEAVKQLDSIDGITVSKVSHVYETPPAGGKKQPVLRSNTTKDEPDYLNAAVEVETGFDAQTLLKVCLGIEQDMGRVRTERWGPRSIDIDLLLYGDFIVNKGDLTVPHPLMHSRCFVIYPLSDIAPDMVHPVSGKTVSQLKVEIGQTNIRKMNNLKLVV